MIVLKDGTYYEPSDEQIIKWQRAYDKLNVHKELEAIANWADANPAKRKVNGPRFVVNWLKRANDSGGSPFAKQDKAKDGKISVRDMDMDDELTMTFLARIRSIFSINLAGASRKPGRELLDDLHRQAIQCYDNSVGWVRSNSGMAGRVGLCSRADG